MSTRDGFHNLRGGEPPPILIWLRVNNPWAADYGRIGMLVDILSREDNPDLARHFVVDFGDGEPHAAFAPDEIERIYVS